MLAGVSVDYYSRLEQGREKNPSASVLDAISRALHLATDAREHLFRLAEVAPGAAPAPQNERVDPSLLALMDNWPDNPAVVLNRRLDILALNQIAATLYSGFSQPDNIVRMTFLDPAGASFFADWHRAAEASVANLRVALGFDPHDRAALALVDELREASTPFRNLWDGHIVRGKTHEAKTFRHPDVGALTLEYNAFDVRSAPGQQLIVYRAEAGSTAAETLLLLGTITATERQKHSVTGN